MANKTNGTTEKPPATAEEQKPKSQLALMKRDIVDVVMSRVASYVQNGQLHLPVGYSVDNAMKSAWLTLQSVVDKDKRPALSVCTSNSIGNSLLDMVVQGLNPGKKQCYFVVHGKSLTLMRSYFGTITVAERVAPGIRVTAEVIWQGDELEYEIEDGEKRITKHVSALANIGGLDELVGAYAVVIHPDGRKVATVMTKEQIEKAWSRGKTYPPAGGKMSPHTDHPDEMAKKTVINRACKVLINRSDDHLLLEAIERQEAQAALAELSEEITENANGDILELEAVGDLDGSPLDEAPVAEDEVVAEPEKASGDGQAAPEKSFRDLFREWVEKTGLAGVTANKAAMDLAGATHFDQVPERTFEGILEEPGAFMKAYRARGGSEPKSAKLF